MPLYHHSVIHRYILHFVNAISFILMIKMAMGLWPFWNYVNQDIKNYKVLKTKVCDLFFAKYTLYI